MVDVLRQVAASIGFIAGVVACAAVLCWLPAFADRRRPLASLDDPHARTLATVARFLRPALVVAAGAVVVLLVLQMVEPARA